MTAICFVVAAVCVALDAPFTAVSVLVVALAGELWRRS
jgi:hypothetical protein